LYYELLQPDETITEDRYQQQLTNLGDALEKKRPFIVQERRKVVLLHNNGLVHSGPASHVAKATEDHIVSLSWELLPHV